MPTLEEYVSSFAGFDGWELARALSGLQLDPANADYLLRLETAVAAALAGDRGRLKPTVRDLRNVVNESAISDPAIVVQEDRRDSLFTEAMTWAGGSYVVFPGMVEEGAYIARNLSKSVFLHPNGTPSEAFTQRVGDLFLAILSLSTAIADKAGIPRGVGAEHLSGERVRVPSEGVLATFIRAVTFSPDELRDTLGPNWLGLIEPLTREYGDAFISEHAEWEPGAWERELIVRPLVRRGEQILVTLPGSLLGTLRHAVISAAVETGAVAELGERYRDAVFDSITKSLRLLEHRPLGPALPGLGTAPTQQKLFTLDTDKALYVLLVADDLQGYDLQDPYGPWLGEGIWEGVEEHLKVIDEELLLRFPAPNEVLHLVLHQGVGRWHVGGLGGGARPAQSERLLMSGADLDVISLTHPGDPLLLWKFARAAGQLRDHSEVITTSALDEFALYADGDERSYYFSDEARPTTLLVVPGSAEQLRVQVAERWDFHGARDPSRDAIVEVAALHNTREVPIFAPWPPGRDIRLLVEGAPLDIWVVGSSLSEERYGSLLRALVDMVAYWIWQATGALSVSLGVLALDLNDLMLRWQ